MDGREHNNALNSLWNFISADYETRLARSGKLNDFIDGGMDYFLGPTGIPNKARAANTMMNPIAQMGQAGADAVMASDPRFSRDERINYGVNALTGSLATLAPAAFMKAAGRPAADAVMETLVNTSRPLAVDGISDAARRFAVSEDGSVPLMGGGKTDPTQTGWTFRDVDASLNSRLSGAENSRIGGDTSRVESVPIRRLNAMQETVNPDFADTASSAGELPLVVRKNGQMFVRDGHHRLTAAAEGGSQNADVRFIDLDNADTSTPLLDWSPEKTGFVEADQALLDDLFGTPAAPTGTNALRSVANAGGDPLPAMRATDEYAGTHTAPQNDGYSSPLHELGGNIYPDDIYSSNAARYYGDGNPVLDRDTMKVLQSMRGKPDEPVSIYRAVPKGVTDINAGDWVTVNRDYAVSHGESNFGDAFDVIEQKVPARDLFTDGNSIHEFGYSPPTATLTPQQEMAERILEMRAAGNAADVTDEMMAMADDVTMFNRTPLPMDEASRMARAQEAGFDTGTPLYHGSAAEDGVDAFDVNYAGSVSQQPNEKAVFLTENPKAAGWFANYAHPDGVNGSYGGAGEGMVLPVTSRGNLQGTDFRGQPYRPEWMEKRLNAAQESGADGLRISGMRENLDGFTPIDNQQAHFNPANIRSRFARFDPEFAHLSNLSAGVAGLGVVGLGATQGQQTDDPYAQRNTLADVMRPAFGNALNGYTPPLPRNALQRGF
tara:strand:- start:5696 stop:7855 length:2160 start_codon:yes stop_codon:yes gene_type:complete